MYIEFDEDKHLYFLNGEIASISVTQLLRKHDLAPDYGEVSQEVLNRAAKRGTDIHKELENICLDKAYTPSTQEGVAFKEIADKFDKALPEQMIGIEWKGISVCGTADLLDYVGDTLELRDHKCTSSFHREYVTWQVNLLDFMFRQLGSEMINGVSINWSGADKLYCNWFNSKTHELQVIELDKIDDEEIIALLNAESNGEKYQKKQAIVDKELENALVENEIKLAKMQLEMERVKAEIESNRALIKETLENQHIDKWESPNGLVKITLKAGYTRLDIDKKKLQKERPDIYDKYVKPVNVSASISVKVDTDKLEMIEKGELENGNW